MNQQGDYNEIGQEGNPLNWTEISVVPVIPVVEAI